MEYQAKGEQLRSTAYPPVTADVVAHDAGGRRGAAAEQLGVVVVRRRSGQRTRQGGRRGSPSGRAREHAPVSLGMDIQRARTVQVLIAQARASGEYRLALLDRSNRRLCIASWRRGRCGIRGSRQDQPGRGQSRSRSAAPGSRRRRPARSSPRPGSPTRSSGRPSDRARLCTRSSSCVTRRTLSSAGQGQGPQLRQARRRGQDHRQRCRPGHVDPRRRRLRRREVHGGVRRANFLDIGGGANAQVMANGTRRHPQRRAGQGGLRQRLRRHHRLRRGRQRHRGALEILGGTDTKPLVVRLDGNNVDEGRRILNEANHPLVTIVDTMDGAADKDAELANA